jgi:hypothetical protein
LTKYEFVEDVPDLIDPSEYDQHPQGNLVRIRISTTANGVEVLGDALRPETLERLLEHLGPEAIEQMLCG